VRQQQLLFEEWRPIPGYPGYEASSEGRIRSWLSGRARMLRPFVHESNSRRYLRVTLCRGMVRKPRVHRLVLFAFAGPCPRGHEAAHRNGNGLDNRLVNLAWVTPEENHDHKHIHGTAGPGHLTRAQITEIRSRLRGKWGEQTALAREFGVSVAAISYHARKVGARMRAA